MGIEVTPSLHAVRIKEPLTFADHGVAEDAGRSLVSRVANKPDLLSYPAAAIIVAATLWASLQLVGLSDNTVDLRISPVSVQTAGAGKAFCQQPAQAFGHTGRNSATDWTFPRYACGSAGIRGPEGPLHVVPDTGGEMVVENSSRGPAIYAVMMANTGNNGDPSATGAEFRDGYAFSPAFAANTGLSMLQFSRQCEAGFKPEPRSFENPTPYGAGQASYAPGTPSMTPDGGLICGDTHITSGDLNLPD